MSFDDLPRQIIDCVMDELGDDRAALAACSLTGWTLLPSCRYIMFSTVTVSYQRLNSLLDLIDTPYPTMGSMIRQLRITGKNGNGVRDGGKGWRSGGSVTRTVSVEAIRSLQRIRYIRLSGIPLGAPSLFRFLSELGGVRGVEVVDAVLGAPERLVEWMCGLPELEEVSVARSVWESMPMDREGLERWRRKGGQALEVSVLDISDWDQVGVMQWLIMQDPVPSVQKLGIGCKVLLDQAQRVDMDILNRFLEVVGPSIEHLYVVYPDSECTNVDFRPCTQVRSIHIGGIRIGPSERLTSVEGFMKTMMGQCGSQVERMVLNVGVERYARSVIAYFGISDVMVFEGIDWGRIGGCVGCAVELNVHGSSPYHRGEVRRVLGRGSFGRVAWDSMT